MLVNNYVHGNAYIIENEVIPKLSVVKFEVQVVYFVAECI